LRQGRVARIADAGCRTKQTWATNIASKAAVQSQRPFDFAPRQTRGPRPFDPSTHRPIDFAQGLRLRSGSSTSLRVFDPGALDARRLGGEQLNAPGMWAGGPSTRSLRSLAQGHSPHRRVNRTRCFREYWPKTTSKPP
jgi:hypothetical protein